jgi:RND superfamily putative drug exporter
MDDSTARPSLPIRLALDHPWRVVGAWGIIIVASIVLIATLLGSALNNDQTTTNRPESMRALELVREHAPDGSTVDEVMVVQSDVHQVGSDEFDAFLAELLELAPKVGVELAAPGGESEADADAASATPPVSKDGSAILVPLRYTADDKEAAAGTLLEEVAAADRDPDFAVDVTGNYTLDHDFTKLSERDLKEGELYVGLPVAMLVLLLVFGTLVGALMPLMIAMVAIICALALAALIGQAWPINLFMVNMVSGMGLALGIDYSLFVLSRYREERQGGSERDAAIRTTGATASRAVLFSGVTFIVALTGMLLVPTTIMRSLALGAILVGITAVLAALTLLPAVLRLLGDRVDAVRVPFIGGRAAATATGTADGFWARLVRRVMRHPIRWGGSVVVLLLVATIPMFGMETGASGISTLPDDLPTRQGYDALKANFPDQSAEPARIVIHDWKGIDEEELATFTDALRARLADDDGYGAVVVATTSEDGKLVELTVPVGTDALSVDAVERVRALRTEHVPESLTELESPFSMQALVTGETALQVDYFDVMDVWLPRVIAFVLGFSFLILLVVFRSITVPIVAIVLNLLSVGATYGLLVLVFQHGIGADLLGLTQVDVTDAWIPLFLFSVLFGLSMDYHMFLLTRIRERWLVDGDTTEAVAWAVGSTGRLITGAALIIVAVFVGFAVGDLVMFQQMGFGIAVALLIDATLVRGVLLPATMALLGEHNWYLPRWLRRLPEIQVE